MQNLSRMKIYLILIGISLITYLIGVIGTVIILMGIELYLTKQQSNTACTT